MILSRFIINYSSSSLEKIDYLLLIFCSGLLCLEKIGYILPMAMFASLIIRLFSACFFSRNSIFLSHQINWYSVLTYFFSEANGAMKVNFLDDVSDFSFAVNVTPLENTKHESFVLVTILHGMRQHCFHLHVTLLYSSYKSNPE